MMLWPSTGAATSCLSLSWVIMRLPGRGVALVVGYGHRRGRGFAPSPICTIMLWPSTGAATSCLSLSWVIMRTTRANPRPGSKLWPSTGAATSCLSPIWVIMRLPGRGVALAVSYGHRRGRGFAPSPICTIMLWPSTGEELRPVPHWGNNEDYQGEGSPW